MVLSIRFGRRREGTSQYSCGQQDFDQVETRSRTTLVFPPTQARNRMREKALSFDELAGKIHLTQLCEKAYFQYLVAARNQYKIRPTGDDGWRTITLLCREYSISRYYREAQALAAIPEGTIIGPVWEVHIVKILDGRGIEVVIPSIANPMGTFYVVKCRETERFVKKIMITKKSSGPATNCSQNFKD